AANVWQCFRMTPPYRMVEETGRVVWMWDLRDSFYYSRLMMFKHVVEWNTKGTYSTQEAQKVGSQQTSMCFFESFLCLLWLVPAFVVQSPKLPKEGWLRPLRKMSVPLRGADGREAQAR